MQKYVTRHQKVADRLNLLADAISERGGLRINEAAELLKVSTMTVRRDLASAPDRFSLLGGHIVTAASLRGYEIGKHASLHENAKHAAAAKAAETLRDGDSVFIDCGTTTAHMARSLPRDLRLTVVCYAMNIAEPLKAYSNIDLIVLGGRYISSSDSFDVPDCERAFSRVALTKAFISAAGLHAERGVTCMNFHEVPVKLEAMKVALHRVLVIDGSKFDAVGPAAIAGLNRFDAFIVGGTAPAGTVRNQIGSRLILAPVNDSGSGELDRA